MQDDSEQRPAPADDERSVEERPEGFRRQWQPRLYLRIVLLALLIAYGIAFVLQNRKQVSVHFVFASTRGSLIWLVLLSVALGILLGVLLSQLNRRRRRRD